MGRLSSYTTKPRIWKYQALSTCTRLTGAPIRRQPLLLIGPGRIDIGAGVQFGWETSEGFHTGYCHVEACTSEASIEIGHHAEINNNAFIKSEGPGIIIGSHALLGSRVVIYDSDFHDLDPRRRRGGQPAMGRVELGENVFVGDRAMILKGVTIGADSIIGAGSVVTSSIPAGVIAVGNPARIVRNLDAPREARARAR
jgi:acetyltransferase-like isoleucine patch superfamily enzyme